MKTKSCLGLIGLLPLTFAPQLFAQLSSTALEDIGFTALEERLGVDTPTGDGVSVSQIEGLVDSTYYRPDTTAFSGKTFTFPSGGSTTASWHATTVGQYLYGTSSLAPDIENITSYSATNWLQTGFLRTTQTNQLPAVETNDIQNHSWVGTTGDTATDQEILRRLDYAIQRDDFVAVIGLNNGSSTSVPSLLAGSYNGITVGLSNGEHSRGGSTVEGTLTRPDIVVPTSATSWATATVSSAAAVLIETARDSGYTNGDNSEVIKAVLLAGASRSETEFTTTWSHTSTEPLDAVYGAGELNIDQSQQILSGAESDASTTVVLPSTGWDLGTTGTTVSYYYFNLAEDSQLSGVLTWNRIITATDTQAGPSVSYTLTSELANLDLKLYTAAGLLTGTEVAISVSTDSNVELIYEMLASGDYVWQITSDTSNIDYGFAWQAISIPEPSITGLLAVSVIFFRRKRR